MIQSTKWYGLKAHSPEEYFKDACHSYQDVSDLLDRKGTNILRDIKPSLESFIHESDTITSDLLIERLLVTNKSVATDIATESIKYTVENIDKVKPESDNSAWFIWSDIPSIRTAYRMGKVNESAIDTLQNALESCAYKVASNLTTYDTIAIESVVDSFNNSVNWEDMMNWDEVRESKLDNPEAVYIGDLISELTIDDCREIAREGVMSDIDLSLQDISAELRAKNPEVKGSQEGYRNLVNDIWTELTEANEDTFDTVVESIYSSRKMTISLESYLSSINRMIRSGCLPALEGISPERILNMSEQMLDKDSAVQESTNLNPRARAQERVRNEINERLGDSVTESMLLEDTNICDNYGMIYNIENDIRDLEMMSFDYIAKESSDDMEDKVSDNHKVVRKVKEEVRKGERNISKAYSKYKLHEDDVDQKLTHIIKKCKGVVFGSSEEARRQMVEGRGYSVVNVLKYIIGGYAVFSVSKVAFFLVLIVRWCTNGKIKRSERKKIIAELEAEKEVIENKIEDARMDGDKEAVERLIRTKHNIIAATKRIKSHDEAEHRGIGAGEVLLNKH